MNFRKQLCFSVVVLMLFLSATAYCAERTVIKPRSASDPEALPFSGAVLVGETLYLSGDIGLDENRKIPDTAEAEAKLVLDSSLPANTQGTRSR